MKQGLLLINLGTPDTPDVSSVRRYLLEFLSDYRVIRLPALLRYLLLYGIILPFRSPKSAHAYQSIWTENGSPLLHHSRQLATQLQRRLDKHCKVVLGMRYGNPSLKDALSELQGCEKITILPLYPQYSSAATGSTIEKILQMLSSQPILPSMNIIRDFHTHPQFIQAQVHLIAPFVDHHDYILFSYHGLPENHLTKEGCKSICANECLTTKSIQPSHCYRLQCFQTTDLIAKKLALNPVQYGTSFQSRLGKTPWIKPYTNEILKDLIDQGIKRLAIVCPSFVADCLETLEEIGQQTREQWLSLGGEQLSLIPCLNDNKHWTDAILAITGLETFSIS